MFPTHPGRICGTLVFVFVTVPSCTNHSRRASDVNEKIGNFQPTASETIVPAEAELELLWAKGEFTEGGAVAPDGAILFADIGNRILRFDPKTWPGTPSSASQASHSAMWRSSCSSSVMTWT